VDSTESREKEEPSRESLNAIGLVTEPKAETEPESTSIDEDLDEQLEQEDEETLGLLGEPDEEG